ncbi:MAG: flagellin [Alphaproteobacteria bacterium]
MGVGIISNIAALSAQTNLSKADADSRASIYRLSSGSSIYQASDNVAGLAVGTIIKTNVSTLQTALTNTAQANSLLGVADGALSSQGDIAQRLKALATQANSGSLSDQNRGYLNAELQNLIKENDRIASTTNFNGINLIDGSLYAPSKMEASTKLDSTRAAGSFTIATALADTNSVFINGVTITGRDTANLATGTSELNFDTTVNTTAADQADAIYNVIQNVLNYQGTDATVLTAKQKLGELTFTHTAATDTISVKANVAGTLGNGVASGEAFCIGADTGTAADVTVNGQDASNVTVSTSVGIGTGAATSIAVNGGLNGGTFGSTTAYTGTARTIAQGSTTDSILRALTPLAQATTGVDVSKVSNNSAFIGNIIEGGEGFKTHFVTNNQVDVTIKVGDYTYEARNVVTNPTANTIVTFASVEAGGGSFSLQLAANNGISTIVDQSTADVLSTRLNAAVGGVDFYQNRDVTNYVGAGTVYAAGSTTNVVGDLAGSSFKMINSDFKDLQVSKVTVAAPVVGATTPTITININGEDYVSGYSSDGSASPLTTTISAGSLGLVSSTNPKNMLVFNYASSTNLDLSSAANAQGLQDALTKAFGVNSGASKISFQVGTTTEDSINVQIESSKSTDLFKDDTGQFVAIDITTLGGAQEASKVIDNAINKLTTIRSTVGALQSRFNYAASNLNTAIQNQDSARGTFLDTDIPSESTKFAQSQVRLQASVSVLAQANQMPQNLLKLIG